MIALYLPQGVAKRAVHFAISTKRSGFSLKNSEFRVATPMSGGISRLRVGVQDGVNMVESTGYEQAELDRTPAAPRRDGLIKGGF
jgi:hypothetical protein